ncbi:MAG: HAD-IIIA family hydrolase [Candidatus Poseidoniaceae archaeon]|nr:HAD-IIIA family hydrolase [Candidatus Poseidoniaceae archaeon]
MDLPGRHGADINEMLELIPLPNQQKWDGSIAYLDRDGVLNVGKSDYVNSVSELKVLAGVGNAVGSLRRAGFRVCVVTNQSPIGRGLWDDARLAEIHSALQERLYVEDEDAHLDLILYSPYTPWSHSYIRKPRPGMLEVGRQIIDISSRGEQPLNIQLADGYDSNIFVEGKRSCMVGDRPADIGAGLAHGVRMFHVDEKVGLSSVVDRIIDIDDRGDSF